VGVSYTWDEGDEGLKKEGGTVRAVWVRKVGDEVKVRHFLLYFLNLYIYGWTFCLYSLGRLADEEHYPDVLHCANEYASNLKCCTCGTPKR
jgi:hypothetical protein